MRINHINHGGLRRLFLDDDARGVPAAAANKLRTMLAFLARIKDVNEIRTLKVWKAHQLTGGRKGTYAFHVTANFRLTVKIVNNEITEVNFEDYH